MSDSWKEKREPAAIWGGWWFWEPPPGKTKEADSVTVGLPEKQKSLENSRKSR